MMTSARVRVALADADGRLAAAANARDATECLVEAYLAAVRAGAAVLAAHPGVRPVRGGPRDVWSQLRRAEPGMEAWADALAGYSDLRARAELGLVRPARAQADALYALAGAFIDAVEDRYGGSAAVA